MGWGGLHFLTILGAFSKLVSGVSGRQHQGRQPSGDQAEVKARDTLSPGCKPGTRKQGGQRCLHQRPGEKRRAAGHCQWAQNRGFRNVSSAVTDGTPDKASVLPSVWKR